MLEWGRDEYPRRRRHGGQYALLRQQPRYLAAIAQLPALRHTSITYQRGQFAAREAGYEQPNLLGGGEEAGE